MRGHVLKERVTPTRAISNRVVHHEVLVLYPGSLWSASRYVTALSAPIPDWSWQDKVRYLEARDITCRVSVFRGLKRHRRKIYETPLERRLIC